MTRARDLADIADKDISGTVTADGLTVDGNAKFTGTGRIIKFDKNGSGEDNAIYYDNTTANNNLFIGRDSSNIAFRTGGSERMRINSSGNVGIGTSSSNKSSSSTALTVNTSSAANYSALELSSGNTLNWHINANNAAVYDVTAGTRPRVFYTNGAERMRIDSSGRVGISTTAPSSTFQVGNGSADTRGTFNPNTAFAIGLKNGSNHGGFIGSGGANVIQFSSSAGAERMRIDSSGRVGIGTSSPAANRALHVSSTAQKHAKFERTGAATSHIEFQDSTTTNQPSLGGVGDNLTFHTAFTERMRIDSSGLVQINTTSGNERLNVHGAIGASAASAAFGGGLERALMDYTGSVVRFGHVNGASGSAKPVTFLVAGAERMRIDSSGRVGIGTSSPSTALDVIGSGGTGVVTATSTNGPQFQAKYSADQWVMLQQSGAGSFIKSRSNTNDGEIVLQGGYTAKVRMVVRTNGDIDFYNTDGTTKKMEWDATANALEFDDNAKATFGAGSDLQIYHDGFNSYISEGGTGNLFLGATNLFMRSSTGATYISAVQDGAVSLYHNNAVKLATTNTGVDVTGGVVASGGLSINSYGDPSNNYITLRPGFAPSASGGVGFAAKDHDGANNDGLGVFGHDGISFTSGGSERMRIDGSGRVGIGTTAPTGAKLKVDGGSTAGTIIQAGNAQGGVILGAESSTAYINTTSATPLAFEINNTERMRIDSSGHLLVGTTSIVSVGSPGNTVEGFTVYNSGSTEISRNSGICLSIRRRSSNGDIMRFHRDAAGGVGSISVTTVGTSYNTSSDHRLKENITDISNAIDRVKILAPKRFNFIEDADTTVDGFLAHEAQAVVPEAVTGTHNEVDEDGNAIMQGIDQSKLVPLLTAALKEAITKIEDLETRLAALEANS